jgi:transcriptional regulator with XRE-family HTH domain
MVKEKIANYVNAGRKEKGWSISDLATHSKSAEGTVKNVCLAKAENPGMMTLMPIMEAIDGSFDEMLYPEKVKTRINEPSIIDLMSAIRETNNEHEQDIRSHYKQHREDMKENYEKRLADKRELIESYKEHIKTLEKSVRHGKIALWICVCVFITVLIAEIMNPSLGWFRY